MGLESKMPDEAGPGGPVVHVELASSRERGFAAVVSLRGEHDLATASEVSEAISAIAGNVLVDLSECTFIDSTVIGVLFARNQDSERAGHVLEVVVPPANTTVARTLGLVRMRDVIVVHEARPGLDAEG
jgi:anti-anti-sigma factor